jgi:molecular chaperone GrpE (heat shock protein)
MAPPPEEPEHEPLSGEATPFLLPGDIAHPDTAKELARQAEELARQLAALTETIRREHERAAHREQVIDRLHAENQQLRHGLLQEALTPVRAGLYRLYDTLVREATRWQGADPPSPELAGPLLSALADEVAEVLGRTGAELVTVEPGDAYDPAVHRPARTAVVGAGAEGTVVEVLVEGFAMGDRVLRKASVVVGRAGAEEQIDGAGTESGVTDDGTDKESE